MIFVSVGTQIPFDRLLKSVERQIEIGNIREEVIVQAGVTSFKSDKMKIINFIPLDEFNKIINKAKLIICHGGVGTITDGLKNGKTIIACPRLKKYSEAKNDHQIQIIENFGKMGFIIPLLDPDDLGVALEKAKKFKSKEFKSNTNNFVKLLENYIDKNITICGWVKNHRKQATMGFIDMFDGTILKSLQVVYDNNLSNFEDVTKIKIGSAIKVSGTLIKSPKENQEFELALQEIELLGDCPENYPIQPKRHSREFLREQAYLRPRTNLFQAVFRVRSIAAHAIHTYFQERGYVYFHAPIITASDCEGAGEMFQVTALDLEKIAKTGKVEYDKDFFGKKAALTVSGQLQGETFALAYKKIYTFGPTFRAENSNTKTHASEFWMIEPEIAFCDLEGDMDIMEDMLKYVVKYVLENAKEEMQFLDKFVENGLIEKLTKLINSNFTRIDHEEVITILKQANVKWEFPPEYGQDIAKEHEKYITEYFNGPVFIKNWPKDIKAFYMKQNQDGKTVAAVDLEVPGAGELMGGSQREEDYNKLVQRMDEMNMPKKDMEWYLNLRKFGSCVHSGFGMGFERLLIYLTGVENIRDVIPYPRTPNNCEF